MPPNQSPKLAEASQELLLRSMPDLYQRIGEGQQVTREEFLQVLSGRIFPSSEEQYLLQFLTLITAEMETMAELPTWLRAMISRKNDQLLEGRTQFSEGRVIQRLVEEDLG